MRDMVTERQGKILYQIVEEYISTAKPVSSGAVFGLEDFGVSCPTIRNEMAELTEKGYLTQPHTSAGRVPTERGYRLFVDSLIAKKYTGPRVKMNAWDITASGAIASDNIIEFLSDYAKDAVILIDKDRRIRYGGLRNVFSHPEFEKRAAIISLFEEFERLEHSIDEIFAELDREIKVFIGSENPFFEEDEFSMIISPWGEDFIALVGPMRMDYKLNFSLLARLLE